MRGADIIRPSRFRPPDPENATAALTWQGQDGGAEYKSNAWSRTYSNSGGRGARPRVTAEPFGGTCFYATILHWPDGRADRLQLFNDPSAAARNARKLDAAFAGCRP